MWLYQCSFQTFVEKLNQWLELVKHLGSDSILESRKSLSHQLLEGVKDHSALAILMLFLFPPIIRGRVMDYVDLLIWLMWQFLHCSFKGEKPQTSKTRHGAIFCTSKYLTITAGAFSLCPSCLIFNGFCLGNKDSYFAYFQGDCCFWGLTCKLGTSWTN